MHCSNILFPRGILIKDICKMLHIERRESCVSYVNIVECFVKLEHFLIFHTGKNLSLFNLQCYFLQFNQYFQRKRNREDNDEFKQNSKLVYHAEKNTSNFKSKVLLLNPPLFDSPNCCC